MELALESGLALVLDPVKASELELVPDRVRPAIQFVCQVLA